jgi:hypothetical protein
MIPRWLYSDRWTKRGKVLEHRCMVPPSPLALRLSQKLTGGPRPWEEGNPKCLQPHRSTLHCSKAHVISCPSGLTVAFPNSADAGHLLPTPHTSGICEDWEPWLCVDLSHLGPWQAGGTYLRYGGKAVSVSMNLALYQAMAIHACARPHSPWQERALVINYTSQSFNHFNLDF